MKIEELKIKDIKKGYAYNQKSEEYICISCGEVFKKGEVYTFNGKMYEAWKAVEEHIKLSHADYVETLINNNSKYNNLTDKQKKLFELFSKNISDKEIASKLNIATSTVRQQKFIFREKAKQAKMYLALYEKVFDETSKGADAIMPIHSGAKMVDMRYVVTNKEKEQIIKAYFESLNPLQLKEFPRKEKKKAVILSRIAEEFKNQKEYTEKEVNSILENIYDDYVTLRRYLIEYGFMDRKIDGSKYWMT